MSFDDMIKAPLAIATFFIITATLSHASSFAIEDEVVNVNVDTFYDNATTIYAIETLQLPTDDILLMIDIANYKSDSGSSMVDNVVHKHLRDVYKSIKLDSNIDVSSSYIIKQGTSDFSSNLLGGITSGIEDVYNLYSYGSTINLASATTKASLMATSSYVGYFIGNYAETALIRPVITTALGTQVGTSIATVFGDAFGGAVVGSLFALGAYATGYTDRHLTRSMMIKSVAGSSVLAGTTFLLGSSTVTVGIFSLGTFILPYLTAVGTYYLIDNFFQYTDAVEESERIDYILENIR